MLPRPHTPGNIRSWLSRRVSSSLLGSCGPSEPHGFLPTEGHRSPWLKSSGLEKTAQKPQVPHMARPRHPDPQMEDACPPSDLAGSRQKQASPVLLPHPSQKQKRKGLCFSQKTPLPASTVVPVHRIRSHRGCTWRARCSHADPPSSPRTHQHTLGRSSHSPHPTPPPSPSRPTPSI